AVAGVTLVLAALAAPLLPEAPALAAPPSTGALAAAAVTLTLALLLAQHATLSGLGGALRSARDHSTLALASGVDPRRARRLALVLAGALAGAAGPVLAMAGEPGAAELAGGGLTLSLGLGVAVLIGGRDSLPGALVAALPLLVLPQLALILAPDLPDARPVLFVVGLVLLHLWRADGSLLDRVRDLSERRVGASSHRAAAAGRA
ncbi:MAG TPA: hypothetical protein VFG43_10335, partial [Geminicoccaceae bacterium]|nr:hypothetical protein [Geminicoccaceae bacterium]